MSTSSPSIALQGIPESILAEIVQALVGLRFGQVTIIVQDGRVMQIDRTDRRRLPVVPPGE